MLDDPTVMKSMVVALNSFYETNNFVIRIYIGNNILQGPSKYEESRKSECTLQFKHLVDFDKVMEVTHTKALTRRKG